MEKRQKNFLLLFGIEGAFYQFAFSANRLGNNLFATLLGANDSELGLIYFAGNFLALLLLLPVGAAAGRMKSARFLLSGLLCFTALMYFLYASVPSFSEKYRMTWFFVFLALTTGTISVYEAQWQSFFGSAVEEKNRNTVYGARQRFMLIVSMMTPLLCGAALSAGKNDMQRLWVLRLLFYLCGAFLLLQAFLILQIRSEKEKTENESIRLVLKKALENQNLRAFCPVSFFFYAVWYLDFSMYYIGQVQFCGLSQAQVSYMAAAVCALQSAAVGLWVYSNKKKGASFTLLFGAGSLVLAPVCMLISVSAPEPIRSVLFFAAASVTAIPQSCILLCLVQLLLSVVPGENRTLTVSLYTVGVLFLNAVMPFLGVRLYHLLGFHTYQIFLFLIRVFAGLWFCFYYRKTKNALPYQGGAS